MGAATTPSPTAAAALWWLSTRSATSAPTGGFDLVARFVAAAVGFARRITP